MIRYTLKRKKKISTYFIITEIIINHIICFSHVGDIIIQV
uniref:Uncharacterized protein n=1 Tax=Anguilla anguilla TaxID=7936 RepID=A0A0E9VE87_ANGAN